MKIGEQPRLRYVRDGHRYIVMLGDDRAGFVAQTGDKMWNAVTTFMSKQRNFSTRAKAGAWLQSDLQAAIARGDV
jgi:hypothetical protein